MATELTMWIYGLFRTVKWPFMLFYVKQMAIIGIAHHSLLIRVVTVGIGRYLKAIKWKES